jgi:hypothetical protein
MARRPHDGHVLFHRFPLRTIVSTEAETENRFSRFDLHEDAAERLTAVCPRTGERLTWAEPTFALPEANIDRLAHFTDLVSGHTSTPPHVEII